jgi:DNA-binding GntR family transcriptional regulator
MEPVEWEPLHDAVYRRLRQDIMSAQYAPGTKLKVRATAEALGVSPMPVRAAFARLAAERAVELTSSGTIFIPRMSRRRLDELVEARVLLEGHGALRAADSIDPDRLARLRVLSDRLGEAVMAGDVSYIQLNWQFKFEVYSAASPVLMDLIERLWLQVGPFLTYYAQDVTAQAETDEYENVVDALSRGDGRAAREATERDITGGAEYLREHAMFDD